MKNENKILIFVILILVIIITIKISKIAIDIYNKERCYNLPINEYVEDKSCSKYTFEEYMRENYGK